MAAKDDPVDPMQARVNAAQRLARVVAGDDDARFVRTVHAVLNAADAPELQGSGGTPGGPTPVRRTRGGAAPRPAEIGGDAARDPGRQRLLRPGLP